MSIDERGLSAGVNGERSTGRPDPSVATATTILREVTMLEEKLVTRIDGATGATDARLDAMDKAITILAGFPTEVDKAVGGLSGLFDAKLEAIWGTVNRHQCELDRVPAMRNEAVEHLAKLVEEKFSGVDARFVQKDVSDERVSREVKDALEKALNAQKEAVKEQNIANNAAVTKSENKFVEQINAQGVLISSLSTSLNTQITTVERAVNTQAAATAQNTGQQIADLKDRITTIESSKKGSDDSWKAILGVVGAMVGLAGVALAAIAFAGNN